MHYNPDKLIMMVNKSGAHSTQVHMETVEELTEKLQNVSSAWGEVAEYLEQAETSKKE